MDVETFAWLRGPEGRALVARAEQGVREGLDDLALGTRLRRTTDGPRAAAAATQARLRQRASAKLGADAARLWFTPDGLEQATRGRVAEHRARRLAGAGPRSVVDLGCGIGGDLLSLARAGHDVTGVDLDPVRVAVAAANLAELGLPGEVQVADATAVDRAPYDVALCDPARRDGRGRTWAAEDWSPPWSFVERLLTGDAVVKAAPGLPHDLVPTGVEAEWVSVDGEVKEAALWSGGLASARRRATLLGGASGSMATLTEADDPGAEVVGVREVGTHLYEPDGAVIRAGLVTAVADRVGGGLVDPHLAYVTADAHVPTPFARAYRVEEELPFREKQLKAALRARGVGRLTIKKRGVHVVPEQLRPRLALRGDEEATVVLTRTPHHGAVALLVTALPADG